MCLCVWLLNVDGGIWIRKGGGGRRGEHERSRQEIEAQGRGLKDRLSLVMFSLRVLIIYCCI